MRLCFVRASTQLTVAAKVSLTSSCMCRPRAGCSAMCHGRKCCTSRVQLKNTPNTSMTMLLNKASFTLYEHNGALLWLCEEDRRGGDAGTSSRIPKRSEGPVSRLAVRTEGIRGRVREGLSAACGTSLPQSASAAHGAAIKAVGNARVLSSLTWSRHPSCTFPLGLAAHAQLHFPLSELACPLTPPTLGCLHSPY